MNCSAVDCWSRMSTVTTPLIVRVSFEHLYREPATHTWYSSTRGGKVVKKRRVTRTDLTSRRQTAPHLSRFVVVLTVFAMMFAVPAWVSRPAQAMDKANPPVAPAGAGPVNRPLPSSAVPNHGYPAGQRPPVVPPNTPAEHGLRRLSANQWTTVPKPGTRRPLDGGPPSAGAALNVLARPGFALDDTSLVVYFDAADPGTSNWASWFVTVYDPDTQAAQDSQSMPPAEAVTCQVPRKFCRSFGATQGWMLADGHSYFVTMTVTFKDGTQSISDPSGIAKARTTTSPPAMPASQSAGCACDDVLAPTSAAQAVRGFGVEAGTGGFTAAWHDLQMAGVGVAFEAVRQYSSTNTTVGSLGLGWSWTYDVRVIPPASSGGAVTVRAEDGAQAVFLPATNGSYSRPPGVRSTLSATDAGWRLTTPDQISYAFDHTGRLTSIRTSRGLGTTIGYTATRWTITDVAGRNVIVDLGSDGLVKAITLPDGRSVKYQYRGGQLSAVTDAGGATWSFGYTGGLLTSVTDPHKRVQVTNTYSAGRVVRQADATGAVTKFAWDATKQEATTVDADGVSVYDGYRGNVLVYTQNGNGDTVNQRYDPSIEPNLVVDPQGNQTVQAFDATGNMTAVVAPDPFGFSTTGVFDGHNNLTSYADGLGHTTTYGYTAFDELQIATDPTGGVDKQQIDERGLVTSVTDPRGKVTTMAYDAAGNLVSRTTPMGDKTTYGYDVTGRMTSRTDPRGNLPGAKSADFTTRFAYDDLDRVHKTYAPSKKQPSVTEYDDLGQLTKTIDPLGNATNYGYTAVIGRIISVADPIGRTTQYTYTTAGRRQSVTDPAGDRTTYTYDAKGNLATVVSPRGNVKGANPADFTTTYIYDANNNLLRTEHAYPGGGFVDTDSRFDELNRPTIAIDALGKLTKTGYDNDNRVISTVDPTGRETVVGFDANGRPITVTAPAGGQRTTAYDAAGNRIRSTSPDGGVTTLTYDDDGRLAATVDPRGNVPGATAADYTTNYGYDAAGNLTTVTDPLGGITRTNHDANNHLTGTIDANGHVTKYQYDDADRVNTVIGPDESGPQSAAPFNNPPRPIGTRYEYDGAGQTTSRTDPNGHTTGYTYDPAGRLSAVTNPLDRKTTYGYDAEGNLTRTVVPGSGDPTARSIVTAYDILGRMVGRDVGSGGTIYAWGYDANYQLTSLAGPAGLRLQTYDDAGHLTSVSRGPGKTFRYGYDGDGNITTREWPDGTTVTAGFDTADHMTSLTVHSGVAGDQAMTYAFSYDPAGRPATATYPASTGIVSDRGYDRAGRLADLNSHTATTTLDRYQLGYDRVGNATAITTTRPTSTQTLGYTYDAANRVTATCVGSPGCTGTSTGQITYGYDHVGNRLSESRTGSFGSRTTKNSYDSADELTTATTGGRQVDYGYDNEGNQTKAGNDSFTYNLDRTVASSTVSGIKTTYTYEADGNQLSAVSNLDTGPRSRSWAVDVNAPLPQRDIETTATPGTSVSRGFLTGPARTPLALLNAGDVDPYLPDWLGGVADLVSTQGISQHSYDYDPYGVPRTNGTASSALSAVGNPIGFAGLYLDPTLDDQYTTPTRVYAPSIGRFDSTDPAPAAVGTPASSSYVYADDRPTTHTDPSGATPCTPIQGGDCPSQWQTEGRSLKPKSDITKVARLTSVGLKALDTEYYETLLYMFDQLVTNAKSVFAKQLRDLNDGTACANNPLCDPAGDKIAALVRWAWQVGPGRPWDHKPILRRMFHMDLDDNDTLYMKIPGYDIRMYYDVWSNIHYGYVGTAAGFDEQTLLLFPKIPVIAGTNDSVDDLTTTIGIDLYRRYKPDQLTPQALSHAIYQNLSAMEGDGYHVCPLQDFCPITPHGRRLGR
jgi:RHS repeat-associated protein